MNNFTKLLEDENAEEIYVNCGEKYDFHLLTAQDNGVISTSLDKDRCCLQVRECY